MALTREEQELILKVTGGQEVERLTQLLKAEALTVGQLEDALRLNQITYAAYEVQMKRTTSSMIANKEAIDQIKAAMGGLTTQSTGMLRAIQSAGYGISDVFANNGPIGSKLTGLANNIPGIVTGIAQSLGKLGPQVQIIASGLEVGLTGIGAALNAFGIKSVKDLVDVFSGGAKDIKSELDSLKEQIKELEAKPVKLAVDTLQLDAAKAKVQEIEAAIKAVEKLRKDQAHYEKESGAAVHDLLMEGVDAQGNKLAGPDIVNKLIADQAKTDIANSGELKAAREEQAKQQMLVEQLKEARKSATSVEELQAINSQLLPALAALGKAATDFNDIQNKLIKGAKTTVGLIIDAAQSGKGAAQVQAQGQLAAGFGRIGLSNNAAAMGMIGPDAILERDRVDDASDVDIAEREKAKQKRHKAVNDGVSDAMGEMGEDLGARVKKVLMDGFARADVLKGVEDQIRASLDAKGEVREDLRGMVAKEAAERIVRKVSDTDVDKAKAAQEKADQVNLDKNNLAAKKEKEAEEKGETKEEKQKQKDADALGKALGDDFINNAALARTGIETAGGGPKMRQTNRDKFRTGAQNAALERLRAKGVGEAEAKKLADVFPDRLDDRVQDWVGGMGADFPVQDRLRQLQSGLLDGGNLNLSGRLARPPKKPPQQKQPRLAVKDKAPAKKRGFPSVPPRPPGQVGNLNPQFGAFAAANQNVSQAHGNMILQLQSQLSEATRRMDAMAMMFGNLSQANQSTSYSAMPHYPGF